MLNSVLRGALLSLALQTVLTPMILFAAHSARAGATLIGVASFLATSLLGFMQIVPGASPIQGIGIGVLYFPTMFGLMFMEAVLFDARIFGNTF